MKKILLVVGALLLMTSTLCADSSVFGMSGLILTPDDQVQEQAQLSLTANYLDLDGVDGWSFGAAYGLIPNLEVSAAVVDAGNTEVMLNAKYRLFNESSRWPSLTVGIADALGEIRNDPSLFLVVGKELTSYFDNFGSDNGFSLRATLGVGTEMYKGIFAGLNWGLTERLDIMGEYINEGDVFSVGAKYKFDNGLSVKAGLLDMDDLFIGVGYNMSIF